MNLVVKTVVDHRTLLLPVELTGRYDWFAGYTKIARVEIKLTVNTLVYGDGSPVPSEDRPTLWVPPDELVHDNGDPVEDSPACRICGYGRKDHSDRNGVKLHCPGDSWDPPNPTWEHRP